MPDVWRVSRVDSNPLSLLAHCGPSRACKSAMFTPQGSGSAYDEFGDRFEGREDLTGGAEDGAEESGGLLKVFTCIGLYVLLGCAPSRGDGGEGRVLGPGAGLGQDMLKA